MAIVKRYLGENWRDLAALGRSVLEAGSTDEVLGRLVEAAVLLAGAARAEAWIGPPAAGAASAIAAGAEPTGDGDDSGGDRDRGGVVLPLPGSGGAPQGFLRLSGAAPGGGLDHQVHGALGDLAVAAGAALERIALAAALEQARRDLDQLSYMISHQLRGASRGIAGLVDWLDRDLGPALADPVRDHLALLHHRALGLEAMLDGILDYMRAGRVRHPVEPVDLGRLVDQMRGALDLLPGVRIRVAGDLPTVAVERAALEHVLAHLLGNAVKHGGPGPLDIEVGGGVRDGMLELSVADDGGGIAPAFHARVWEPFQTLAPRDRIEGAGMGLAVVRRAVETRGGRVALESAPGRGARFSFTWPVA